LTSGGARGGDAAAGVDGPVGVLGGTFDPVHAAHLRIAQLALDVLELERLLWIPTGQPGYRNAPVAAAEARLAMLRLALEGEPRYAIDARELAPGASGYTVDTLAGLRAELGARRPLVLLMGEDQFVALATWHRWRDLFALAHLAVFARPASTAAAEPAVMHECAPRADRPRGAWRTRPAGAVIRIDMPPLDISATELRSRLAQREDVSTWVPSPVVDYIERHRLYAAA